MHALAQNVKRKCTMEVNRLLSCGLIRVLYTRTEMNTPTCKLHKHAEFHERSYNYNNTTTFTQWRSHSTKLEVVHKREQLEAYRFCHTQ